MEVLFGIVCVIIAIAMVLVVVVQNSKGGGLASTFGGSATQILGARRSNEFIEKLTWYLAIGLAVFAFAANIAASSGLETDNTLKMDDAISNPLIGAPTASPLGE